MYRILLSVFTGTSLFLLKYSNKEIYVNLLNKLIDVVWGCLSVCLIESKLTVASSGGVCYLVSYIWIQ